MTSLTHPGARWWKIDFHAHSPYSFDFGGLEGQETQTDVTVEQWLLAYMQAGIDGIVVSDHNEHAGIKEARTELKRLQASDHPNYRELTIFPGVEITTHSGYHLLAIFDPQDSEEAVNGVLHQAGYGGARGTSSTTTTKSFHDVCEIIVKAGGLAIPAHAADKWGILTAEQRTLAQIRESGKVIAVELTGTTGIVEAERAGWVPVLGSDAHHLDDATCPPGIIAKYPGSHYTWMKMQKLTLNGVRLALADGRGSTRRSIDEIADPNDVNHHRLERLVLRRGEDSVELPFSPWLNALIGGRGVGKSTLVEMIRLGLDRFDELPNSFLQELLWFSPKKQRPTDERYWSADTEIEVSYTKSNQPYRITWSGKNPHEPRIEVSTDEGWVTGEGSIRDRFPVQIYSQKQIYETAKNPQSLLKIIDAQPSIRHAEWSDEFELLKSEYAEIMQNIATYSVLIESESRLKGELADVNVTFEAIQNRRDSAAARELDALVAADLTHEALEREAVAFESRLRQSLGSIKGLLNAAKASNQGWGPEDRRYGVEELAIRDVESSIHALESSRLEFSKAGPSPRQERIAHLRSNFDEMVVQSGLDATSVNLENQFEHVSAKRSSLEGKLNEINQARVECESLRLKADIVLDKVRAHRKVLTDRRKEFLRGLSLDAKTLKIELFEMADQSNLEKQLREFAQKPDKFEPFFSGPDGAQKVLVSNPKNPLYLKELDQLKLILKQICNAGSNAAALAHHGLVIDGRLATHIMSLDGTSFGIEVDLWFPEDLLRVRYKSADENEYRSLEQGSPGQKTATLLSVILRMSSDPLVLDQPEDDLDNALITDLIVQTLKQIKDRRQVIVVTHNANVVVNADSELVSCLSYGEVPAVAYHGSIQDTEVRDAICRIMEGGEKAFASRYQRLLAYSAN